MNSTCKINDPDTIKIVVGGDVNFDLVAREDAVISDLELGSQHQRRIRTLFNIIGRKFNAICLQNFPQYFIDTKNTSRTPGNGIYFNFHFKDEQEEISFSFSKICSLLKSADITFVNLETPLSDNCRVIGPWPTCSFISKPMFADSLFNAGIDVVSVANNHVFDAGEKGFLDTIKNLKKRNIQYIGGGKDLKDARTPVIFDTKGMKIAFLGYTQICNHNFTSVADDDRSGILPFSLPHIVEDIKSAKKESDLVCISLHWGIENTQKIHPKAIEYARAIIDAGADIIFGHHPHIPQGIEIYKSRPIFYSFGNFIFGHNREYWQDNFLAEIYIQKKQLKKIVILPISGRDYKLYRPELLLGNDARKMLLNLQKLSSKLNTMIEIEDNKGIILP